MALAKQSLLPCECCGCQCVLGLCGNQAERFLFAAGAESAGGLLIFICRKSASGACRNFFQLPVLFPSWCWFLWFSSTPMGRDSHVLNLDLKVREWEQRRMIFVCLARMCFGSMTLGEPLQLYLTESNRDLWSRFFRAEFFRVGVYLARARAPGSRLAPDPWRALARPSRGDVRAFFDRYCYARTTRGPSLVWQIILNLI